MSGTTVRTAQARRPDYIVLPRRDGSWLLTREGDDPASSTVFPSLYEAVSRGRELARDRGVQLRVQDLGEDTQKDSAPGEGKPDWTEPI